VENATCVSNVMSSSPPIPNLVFDLYAIDGFIKGSEFKGHLGEKEEY